MSPFSGLRPPASPISKPALREQIRQRLHSPWTEVLLMGLILVSVLLVVAEAGLSRAGMGQLLQQLGDGINGLFILELSLRYWIANRKSRFFQNYVNRRKAPGFQPGDISAGWIYPAVI